MFGFSLAVHLFQGSAQRTWNCVAEFSNLLWYKFNQIGRPIMPRSRRRHHSRSRSRSRSHSHDRDREPKRRKIEGVDSPAHKRSVSCEPHSPITEISVVPPQSVSKEPERNEEANMSADDPAKDEKPANTAGDTADGSQIGPPKDEKSANTSGDTADMSADASQIGPPKDEKSANTSGDTADMSVDGSQIGPPNDEKPANTSGDTADDSEDKIGPLKDEKPATNFGDKLAITPQKAMSPKQLQKKMESEQKRKQKEVEREEREKKKELMRLEKLKQKQEKDDQKTKEKELKRKEKEEKEQKRKEKEEREEQKRKEREQEKLRKQQELDEKNKEKQKQEEQKQKAAAAFVNFFLPKRQETGGGGGGDERKPDAERTSIFMPFQVKSDMRLPPLRRPLLTETEKDDLVKFFENPETNSYLQELRAGKTVRKSPRTWRYEDGSDDVVVVEEEFGESIYEDKPKAQRMRAKFLKFHENRRPAYFGTWRKTSGKVKARKPFAEDTSFFDYEVESDDDWEEEEQGESLNGSDDEDKENEVDNDDYEVDNDFFVPHGHLSDDEVDDESSAKLSPESLKQKLKLLKDEFDHDMKAKTHKVKPRSIGCIWYNKDGSNVEEAIDRHLKPLAMITNGKIFIQKRSDSVIQTPIVRKYVVKEMKPELVPVFLKLIHGNVKKSKVIVAEFLTYMRNNGSEADMLSKQNLTRNLKQFAQWKKCPDEGSMFNKFCWYVQDDVKEKYNMKFEPLK